MQNNQLANSKRREKDVMKLMMNGKYQVQLTNEESTAEFEVLFQGPNESLYEGGWYKVRVQLPDMYPYKSPSIGFKNRIYHPNIDEISGSVCLDVINQTWSPMYDLINIFEIFLPQLLLYPNPTDPLNPEAAQMQLKYEEKYKEKIKDYISKYAQLEDVGQSFNQLKQCNQGSKQQQKGSHNANHLNGHKNGHEKNGKSVKKDLKAGDNLSETSLNKDDDDDEDLDEDMLDCDLLDDDLEGENAAEESKQDDEIESDKNQIKTKIEANQEDNNLANVLQENADDKIPAKE